MFSHLLQSAFAQKLLSLLALTAVSTSIGVTMKVTQTNGTYAFSPASSAALTEAYKLLMTLLITLCLARAKAGASLIVEMKRILTENMTYQLVWHEFILAIAYVFVNIVTFPIFTQMSASMFYMLKASSPVVTAIILRVVTHRVISKLRWFSIIMQCFGLLVTQVNFCSGSTAATQMGYTLVFFNLVVSCLAGVYNEQIIKNERSSVNAQNFVLYGFGVILNSMVHFLAPASALGMREKPGFLDGYGTTACMVVVANGSVGLVITAVYKYADVVVKTFGIAASTSILFLLEALDLLPTGTHPASLLITTMGAQIIFYAAYVYIMPDPKPLVMRIEATEENDDKNFVKDSSQTFIEVELPRHFFPRQGFVLGILALITLFIAVSDISSCPKFVSKFSEGLKEEQQ